MIIFFIVVAALLIVLFLIKQPAVRGVMGEFYVRLCLGKTIPGERYVIHNYQVQVEDTTVQIDHMVVNENGIYVIETKNYSGRIYGNESSTKWTQVLAYGKVKNPFYNPIMQNGTHIKRLEKILDRQGIFRNLVVFVQNNTYEIVSDKIVSTFDLRAATEIPFADVLFSPEDITALYEKLVGYQEDNAVSNAEHIENIKTMQENIDAHICPRCGNQLVLRNGKHGEFWGCSQYPNCKFIKKL